MPKKRPSVAAVARKLGVPREKAKQVAAHALIAHNLFTKAHAATRQAKHASALAELKGEFGRFTGKLAQRQKKLRALDDAQKTDVARLEKALRKMQGNIAMYDTDVPKPDPDSGRP